MEHALTKIALGENLNFKAFEKASLISYLHFPVGRNLVYAVSENEMKEKFYAIKEFSFDLKVGEKTKPITNSLNRYGHFIISGENVASLLIQRKQSLII